MQRRSMQRKSFKSWSKAINQVCIRTMRRTRAQRKRSGYWSSNIRKFWRYSVVLVNLCYIFLYTITFTPRSLLRVLVLTKLRSLQQDAKQATSDCCWCCLPFSSPKGPPWFLPKSGYSTGWVLRVHSHMYTVSIFRVTSSIDFILFLGQVSSVYKIGKPAAFFLSCEQEWHVQDLWLSDAVLSHQYLECPSVGSVGG